MTGTFPSTPTPWTSTATGCTWWSTPAASALQCGTVEAQRDEVLAAVAAVLEVPPEHIHVKTHTPQPWGRSQYERVGPGQRAASWWKSRA